MKYRLDRNGWTVCYQHLIPGEDFIPPLPGFKRVYHGDTCVVDIEVYRLARGPASMIHEFKVGDQVVKNPKTWRLDDLSAWGRGEGVGIIVMPPFELNEGSVDVAWPSGRCFERVEQLLRYQSE